MNNFYTKIDDTYDNKTLDRVILLKKGLKYLQ